MVMKKAGLVAGAVMACLAHGAQGAPVRSWAVAMQAPWQGDPSGPAENSTVRQAVRLSAAGERLRLVLDNQDSASDITIDHIEVALADAKGQPVPGTARKVSVGGREGFTVPQHAALWSDWLSLGVAPLGRVVISFHLPAGQKLGTMHGFADANTQVAPGDQTSAPVLTGATTITRRYLVAGVDVDGGAARRAIITFGDSITDGVRGTVDADQRWPDQFAARLQAAGLGQVGVANMGISGNRMLGDGAGLGALARFDRDVLAVSGASHVIVLEGVNDIGSAWRDKRWESFDTQALITSYAQMVERAHAHGLKVVLGTILPFKGAGYWSEWGEAQRQKVNSWIRAQKLADGVVDFDAALRDKADPLVIAAAFDCGDHLHPNDAGFTAMAAAVPLALVR
jgi:lysophospholipase L1-like esterase